MPGLLQTVKITRSEGELLLATVRNSQNQWEHDARLHDLCNPKHGKLKGLAVKMIELADGFEYQREHLDAQNWSHDYEQYSTWQKIDLDDYCQFKFELENALKDYSEMLFDVISEIHENPQVKERVEHLEEVSRRLQKALCTPIARRKIGFTVAEQAHQAILYQVELEREGRVTHEDVAQFRTNLMNYSQRLDHIHLNIPNLDDYDSSSEDEWPLMAQDDVIADAEDDCTSTTSSFAAAPSGGRFDDIYEWPLMAKDKDAMQLHTNIAPSKRFDDIFEWPLMPPGDLKLVCVRLPSQDAHEADDSTSISSSSDAEPALPDLSLSYTTSRFPRIKDDSLVLVNPGARL